MVTLGLSHISHAAGALSTAVHHPGHAKIVAPLVLTLFGFTPAQVEVLIAGFFIAAQGTFLAASRIKSRLPTVARIRHS